MFVEFSSQMSGTWGKGGNPEQGSLPPQKTILDAPVALPMVAEYLPTWSKAEIFSNKSFCLGRGARYET